MILRNKQNHSEDDIHRSSHVIEDVILNAVEGRGVVGFLDDFRYNISFSIGIVRYPENGKNLDISKAKLQRAIDIARAKGGNRYIIYKEVLHGEIEDSDK